MQKTTILSPPHNNEYTKGITSHSNIYACYRTCRRRKRRTANALLFEQNLEQNIMQLAYELRSGTYNPRPALAFMLHKPKQREIFAADFYDRVVHHILVKELEPIWERRFIHDSYACRVGKGNLAAVKRLQKFTRQVTCNGNRQAYFLQLDIMSYFTSINRKILYARLCKVTKHPLLQELMRKIIYQDITADCRIKGSRRADFMALPARKTLFKAPPHKGLPIGNLTSQFFGNVYLDALDQYIKHTLKVRCYVRYCDDFVLLADSKEQLEVWRQQISIFLIEQLDIVARPDYKLATVSSGIDFLGYIVRPSYLLSRRRVVANLDRLLYTTEKSLRSRGYVSHASTGECFLPYDSILTARLVASLNAYHGHLAHAKSHKLWQRLQHRYSWLVHYVQRTDDGVFEQRYKPWKPTHFFIRQVMMASYRFPGHIIVVQIGNWWQVILPPATRSTLQHHNKHYVHDTYVHAYAQSLQTAGKTVVGIAQTGKRITTIHDRQLAWMYAPNRKAVSIKNSRGVQLQ